MPELAWLVLLDDPRPGTVAVAEAVTATAAGHLLISIGRVKPHRDAVRVEPSLWGDGPAMAVSLVLPRRGERLLFDDPAVVHAMKAVLSDAWRVDAFSTLVDGSTMWAGSVSAVAAHVAAARPAWWDDDPFARLARRHRLRVPPGVLAPQSPPVGPSHQRHAGAPWPWGAFATV